MLAEKSTKLWKAPARARDDKFFTVKQEILAVSSVDFVDDVTSGRCVAS